MKKPRALGGAVAMAMVVFCCAAEVKEKPRVSPPPGTWERSEGGYAVTLTFTDGRLHLKITRAKESALVWLMDADFGVTKDSILFGIVTSIEKGKVPPGVGGVPGIPGGEGGAPGGFDPGGAMVPGIGTPNGSPTGAPPFLLIDDLFRFRFRHDDDILTIKDINNPSGLLKQLLSGRFKKVEPKKSGNGVAGPGGTPLPGGG